MQDTHIAGFGTEVHQGFVRSLLVGTVHTEKSETEEKEVVSVRPKGTLPAYPHQHSVVLVKIVRVASKTAHSEILVVGPTPVYNYTGIIRSTDVRDKEIDKVDILACFRPGDIVRAVVLSSAEARTFFLSTARNDLGVVHGKSAAGAVLTYHSETEMQCPVTFTLEKRKVAVDIVNTCKMSTVFVTVGTTRFDALITAIDSMEVVHTLGKKGYRRLIIQMGNSAHRPFSDMCSGDTHTFENGLKLEIFKFAPNLDQYMQDADLVISHAGSGSLFEALRLKKTVVAVPNPILMHNHQAELANHLEKLGCCYSSTSKDLIKTLNTIDFSNQGSKLKELELGNPKDIGDAITLHMRKYVDK